jgi:aminoglycoside phosphotransferase (APT) family kinase protein
VPYEESLVRSIAERHGVDGAPRLLPKGGMVNEAWAIGERHILRIVEEGKDSECDDEAPREAAVVPLVVGAGITAPRLIAADTAFAPRPYTIYEMARGELIGFSRQGYAHFEPAFRQMGRDAVTLHRIPIDDGVRAVLRDPESYDFDKWIVRSVERGAIDQATADDIEQTVGRWREIGGEPPVECIIHNDLHPWNVMGDPVTGELTAILDWGDTSLGDPARDFAMLPLPCAPAMLDGYLEAGGKVDAATVARSLVVGMSVALFEVSTPEMAEFDRRWWRMPDGGWPEMKALGETLLSPYS